MIPQDFFDVKKALRRAFNVLGLYRCGLLRSIIVAAAAALQKRGGGV
ncbi:hypothetical protein [Alloprevotella tannerae]|nr:hypothetical protein [Alloprevotella tannerae]